MSTKRRSFPPPLCLLPLFISLEIGRVGSLQLLLNVSPEQATEDRVPDSPTNVRVSQLTPNAATIKWDRPLSADLVLVRGYTLSYGVDSADARRVVLEGQDTLEHTVHGLKPNTSYAFSLTAYNEAETEDSARVLLLVNTPSLPARDAPEPEESAAGALKPTHLRVERTRQRDEVLLHWNEPVDKLGKRPLYYIVHYSREMFHEVQRLSVERSPALLVGLNSGHKYTARVRAVFDDGTQSAWSDKLTLNGREQSALTWGGLRDAEEEEDFCGFELPSVCDFIREGSWRWERRNSTGDGFNIVLRESASGTAEDQADGLFGRLLSPMYGLSPSDSFCISVQLKLAKGGFGALFRLGVLFEGEQRAMWLFRKSLQRVWPQGEWIRLSFQLHRRPTSRGFQVIFDVSKQRESEAAEFVLSLDNLFVRAADCPAELEPYFGAAPDEETEANLLIPLENLLDSDQRVYRATGLDGLPAVGIKRGVEIVVPYRIYLPRKFYRNFAILASVRPADHLGGFLFAVLNAFDTVVELGLQLQPSGPAQTNISLLYTDSQTERESRVLASFLVPAFTGQWTQFALEVHEQSVGLYFRCMRFAIRQVLRRPAQLQMDDASKLYIANAGPILGGGFEVKRNEEDQENWALKVEKAEVGEEDGEEFPQRGEGADAEADPVVGAIQELKLHDDAAEAANQCNENWWKTRRRNFARQKAYEKDAERDAGSGFGAPDEEKPQGLERMTPPTVSTTFAPPLTMTQTGESQQFGRWTPTAAVGLQGPPGLKGEPGEPGTCIDECRIPPPGPPGLPGPPGTFVGLSDADVLRIAAWPGVKGEKGECAEEAEEGADELVLLNGGAQHRRRLPVYDSRVHAQKGPKGDRGEPGVPGPPGVAAPQQQNHPATGSAVAVYQTALELLAAAPRCPVGRLAFAVSTQQLFLRVHAGWRQILLDSTILAQPQAEAPVAAEQHAQLPASHPVLLDSAPDPELSRLAYWLALDEQPNSGRGEKSAAVIESVLASPLVAPAAPSNSPPTRSVDARPWQSRWPQKEPVAAVDEERDKQRNRVDGAIRHKDKVIHLMALNEPLAGNFGGVRGADMECYRQARQAGFSTTFRAFLSSRVQDLSKIVHVDDRHHTPVVNLRGERLFDSWHSVFDGGAHAHVPLYSFNKKDIFMDRTWSDRWMWHGSSSGGLRSPTYCAEWRSLAAKAFGMASPLHAKHALTDQPSEMTCDRKLAVLCVEVMSKYSVDRKLGKRFMADLF